MALFLQNGAAINDDVSRRTARKFSAQFNVEAIELLTAYGANWNVVLDDGRTAADTILDTAAKGSLQQWKQLKSL